MVEGPVANICSQRPTTADSRGRPTCLRLNAQNAAVVARRLAGTGTVVAELELLGAEAEPASITEVILTMTKLMAA